jgi:hypothetical protein
LHRLTSSHKHEQEALSPDSPVTNGHLEDNPMGNLFFAVTLSEPDTVDGEAVAGKKGLFFVKKSLAVGGVVGHQKENGAGGNNRG